MTTEAGTGVMRSKSRKASSHEEAGQGKEQVFLWNLWREGSPPETLISAQ